MRVKFVSVLGLCAALLPGQAWAGPHADTLGRCAVSATSADDRSILTRWMFVSAASNPALADLASVSAEAREQSFRAMGALFNRIMLTACRRETVAAIRHEGVAGIQGGFQALGQLAGIEMMTAPEAQAVLQGLDRYIDAEGMEALGREAAAQPAI